MRSAVAPVVRVVVYEDLQCGDCAAYRTMLHEKLLPKYASSVAFEHREFPLPKHSWARQAAIAARYFESIGPELGAAFRRFCLTNRSEVSREAFPDAVRDFAERSGADPAEAVASLQDADLEKQVEQEYQEGVARGVSRTPTVFVNGKRFVETFTFDEISESIDAALAAAGAAGKDK